MSVKFNSITSSLKYCSVNRVVNQLKWEMFCLQNHIPNMNTTKSLHAYLKKDLALTLDHLMIMMYRFVKKTGNNL